MGKRMIEPLTMKDRPHGFLRNDELGHDTEAFDYVRELHDILWRFVRAEIPSASGQLTDWIPAALAQSESRRAANKA